MPHTLETQSTGPALSPLAGKPAPKEMLIDVARLEREYFERKPDLNDPNQTRQLRNQRTPRVPSSRCFQ